MRGEHEEASRRKRAMQEECARRAVSACPRRLLTDAYRGIRHEPIYPFDSLRKLNVSDIPNPQRCKLKEVVP